MPRFSNRLKHVRVAAPCRADWDQMMGSDRVRFCGQCSLNVYNLSAMTRDEAESLIARSEGRLCVRFFRRNDGSIITQDCPVGLRAVQARVSYWTKALAAAVLTFLATLGFQSLRSTFRPLEPRMIMGEMRVPAEEVIFEQGILPQPSSEVVVGELVERQPHRKKHR
jgi:hypothetical protein